MEIKCSDHVRICQITSFLLVFSALFSIFPLHLLPCFLSGFIVYETILALTPIIERLVKGPIARWISIMFLSMFVILTLVAGITKLITFLLHDFQNLASFHLTANKLLEDAKHTVSPIIARYLPLDINDLQEQVAEWLRKNLVTQTFGTNTVHIFATMLIGMVLGAIISLRNDSIQRPNAPLSSAILNRLRILSKAFHNVIFAQIKVSLVNTVLTGIFLFAVLPMFLLHFPFSKTIVVLTFFSGLLPIIGNLISNTAIVLIGLSISLEAGSIALTYLILIHKLEYFINAQIFSSRINAETWEILLAMLILESTFGVSGVIAAPIYYAYLKAELRNSRLI
ncbi:AI-2E family transporter [Candidatus Erwinia haradaeae]|uniref:AI-2E transporter family protein n=1 Tax=Candidatus Erwinia haradaeae TaxID=1922217 RepID=A0A451D7D4_9GAMM|nr:AI-2E family transporter [Candidatus Erwinia haradaeae]VFP81717.1 AI-2E transporter family protein [Candidatus Erwinia haradaeae]